MTRPTSDPFWSHSHGYGSDHLTDAEWRATPKVRPRRWRVEHDATGYLIAAKCDRANCTASWQGSTAATLAKAHTMATGHRTVAVARVVVVHYWSPGRDYSDPADQEEPDTAADDLDPENAAYQCVSDATGSAPEALDYRAGKPHRGHRVRPPTVPPRLTLAPSHLGDPPRVTTGTPTPTERPRWNICNTSLTKRE
jgi:hypothetical protein